MKTFRELLGVEQPIIQAPMAGVQRGALAIAVCNAGGLGSLPCAMLSLDEMRSELGAIRARTSQPFNVNFFCHTQPELDARREAVWSAILSKYYEEYGIVPPDPGAGR